MSKKVFIDSFLQEGKECSCGKKKKNKTRDLEATKKAITETALKSIIRSLQTEGYINEEKAEVSKTARRINADKIGKKLPQCPPGYVFSKERMDCIPKTQKDKVSGRLENGGSSREELGGSYNVWGRTGVNGDGYAYEDPPKTDMNNSDWSGYEGTQVMGEEGVGNIVRSPQTSTTIRKDRQVPKRRPGGSVSKGLKGVRKSIIRRTIKQDAPKKVASAGTPSTTNRRVNDASTANGRSMASDSRNMRTDNDPTRKKNQYQTSQPRLRSEEIQEIEEGQKQCEKGYEYDTTQNRCVRKRSFNRGGRSSIIYTPPYLSGGHHGVEDNDEGNDAGDASGGGDGGGMAEGMQVGTSFIREVCKRCGRGLVKNTMCQCLQARDSLYPRLIDRVR